MPNLRPAASSSSKKSAAPLPARERLLDAAAVVFARDGLAASTTREIARTAEVNEVTLFRLFQTKQNLMTAVIERIFAAPAEEGTEGSPAEPDLTEIVRGYAVRYAARINKNVALSRVLIGEIQHFQENELKVLRSVFEPTRRQVIDRLRVMQKAGLTRKDMDPAIVADQINAIIFMGALKDSLPLCREYSTRDYIEACVQTIVRAIGVPEAGSKRATGKQ
jgi:AcrR family transcriptional regulator